MDENEIEPIVNLTPSVRDLVLFERLEEVKDNVLRGVLSHSQVDKCLDTLGLLT